MTPPASIGALVASGAGGWMWEEPPPGTAVRRARGASRDGTRQIDLVCGPASVVEAEAGRLRWLAASASMTSVGCSVAAGAAACGPRLGVPVVLALVDDGPRRWLASEAPPGLAGDAPASLADPVGVITRFANALRALHDSPAADCPFDASTEVLLAQARARVEAGEVDAGRLRAVHRRSTPTELLAHLEAFAPLALSRPSPPPTVLTHGRPELANVVLEPRAAGDESTEVSGRRGPLDGWRRLERLGVGDPYRDLAVAARRLAERFDASALPPFFDAYGLPSPDPVRLEFFVLLDELS